MAAGPGAGSAPTEPDADTDDNVLVTICRATDGGYTVYAGDEPEGDQGEAEGGADMSEADTDAMGPAGDQAAGGPAGMGGNGGAPEAAEPQPQGQPAASIGEALKAAMDILRSSEASAPGGAQDQFAAGFAAPREPTPAAQKYPPGRG
jgi:hypothetical protein